MIVFIHLNFVRSTSNYVINNNKKKRMISLLFHGKVLKMRYRTKLKGVCIILWGTVPLWREQLACWRIRRSHQRPEEETKCLPCLFYDSRITSCINCSNCGCFKGQVGTNIDRTLLVWYVFMHPKNNLRLEMVCLTNQESSFFLRSKIWQFFSIWVT